METPNGMMARQKRSLFPSIFVVAKKHLLEALENFTKGRIFPVRVENDRAFYNLLLKIRQDLQILQKQLREPFKVDVPPTKMEINVPSPAKIPGPEFPLEDFRNLLFSVVDRINFLTREFTKKIQVPSAKFDDSKILQALKDIQQTISTLKLEVNMPATKSKEIKFPEFPREISFSEADKILKALNDVKDELKELPKKIPEAEFPDTINIGNFPPQKIPQPVTNINLNPLRGTVKTTSVTVSTTRLPLPGEVLANRRGLVVFNNSTTVTVFVGGANVVAGDGMPIPPKTYSPALDAGPRMILYGITSSGSADIRVMELSNENLVGN